MTMMAYTTPTGSYTTTVQGVTCTSNVATGSAQPTGTLYTHTINFSVPFINALAGAGINFIDYVDHNYIAQQFAGAGHTISNLSVTTPSANSLQIQYNATSPTILEAVTLVIGIVIYIVGTITGGPVGAAIGALIAFAGAASLVISGLNTLVQNPAVAGAINTMSTGVKVLIVAAVVGAAFVAYGMLKSGKTTSTAKKAFEKTSKVALS